MLFSLPFVVLFAYLSIVTSATRSITPWTVFVVVYFGLYFGPGLLLDNDPVKPNLRSARYWIGVILSLVPVAIVIISLYIGNVHDLVLGGTALLAGLFFATLYQTVSVKIYDCDKCGRPEKFQRRNSAFRCVKCGEAAPDTSASELG
jgi:hypothetical protein